MEMTITEDYLLRLEPGEVLEFGPTARSRAAARDAEISAVPPSFMQDSHIRRWAERQQGDGAGPEDISLSFTVPARLDRAALLRAFTAFILRHETLRCWYDFDTMPQPPRLRRRIVDATDIEFATTSLGDSTSVHEIRDVIVDRIKQGVHPLAWPTFFCGAVDHGERGFTVIYTVDHANTDGLSLAGAFFELQALYDAYAKGEEPTLLSVGSHVGYAAAERAEIEPGLDSPAVGRLVELLLHGDGGVPPLPVRTGLAPGQRALPVNTVLDLLDAAECDAFAAECTSADGTFSAGLFTTLALTNLVLGGQQRYLGLNVVGTRSDPKYLMAQGWFVNLMPISFEVGASATFRDVIPRAAAALARVKPLTSVPILGAMEIARATTGADIPPTWEWPWMSYLDVRRFAGVTADSGKRIVSHATLRTCDRSSPIWFNREADRIHASVIHPDTPVAHQSYLRYFELMRTIMRSVAAHGDYVAQIQATVGA